LMRAYSACAKPEVAHKVFDKTPERNIVIYNVMIRSYVNNHSFTNAISIYKDMAVSSVAPDHYTLPCILKACSASNDLKLGLQIHCTALKTGLGSTLYTGNGLISMYGKFGDFAGASWVLDEMPYKDVISWNSLIAGYSQNARFEEALKVCERMEFLSLRPDSATMASLLPAVTNTSMENIVLVEKIFSNMSKKELAAWNVMISVYSKNSMSSEAVRIYSEMVASGVEPDVMTIASILPACGDLSAASLGKRIHEYVDVKGFTQNLSVGNALVDMYAKCGCLKEARDVFEAMAIRDVISWTSMISAYGKSGEGKEAVDLFSKMVASGHVPDSVAFVSILSACSHAGLLSEGRRLYKSMIEEYRIVPGLEHFSCMVDLLGRAGDVDEAYDHIKRMPMKPNEKIWGALLNACHVYNNVDIGVIAADRLFQLSPRESGYYVLLSNMYTKGRRWKDASLVRLAMKRNGIKKLPGVSNVEVDNVVHAFLAGDRYHPESDVIYEELEKLLGKIREAGYVPITEAALHDVEEEDKENHLGVHSEKLAIVFALMNTQPGLPIRITKNLRVCEDCHIAVKFISDITQRRITVRDTNRFHHFENGNCSCRDYW
ncbi:hypothetical protein M569_01069, partial [Genlisea aurea]